MLDPSNIGRTFPPFSYTLERGKLREFMLAIGDDNPDFAGDDPILPPTFPTVFTFWGGYSLEDVLHELGTELKNVLHAEQEYEYLASVRIGDTVTGQQTIKNIYERGGINFVELITAYKNQNDESVLNERALIIVNEPKEES